MFPVYDMSLCHVLLSTESYSKLIPSGPKGSSPLHSLSTPSPSTLISKVRREMACQLILKIRAGVKMEESLVVAKALVQQEFP